MRIGSSHIEIERKYSITTTITISEQFFCDFFRPIWNPINPNASFDWGDGFGTLFETYGDDFKFVQSQKSSHVWTLLSGDDGDFTGSGCHFVNRLGYFVTQMPEGYEIEVEIESIESDDPLVHHNLTE